MDFSLTKEQIKEYIARCVNEASNDYSFEILNCAYPQATIKLYTKNGSLTYQMIFTNDYVFCKYQPLCLNMQEIYLEYMYELFGEEYLAFLEKNARQENHVAKEAAHKKYVRSANEADNKLIDLLLFLNKIRGNSFQQ